MHQLRDEAKPPTNYDDLYDSEFISFDHGGLLYSDDGWRRLRKHNSCIYERSVAAN